MFQFLGYDFLGGPDSLDYAPTDVQSIGKTKLTNAIFDHFNVTKDIELFGDITLPEGWTYDTILNAAFNNSTSAGNLEYAVGKISGIKIKRRIRPVGVEYGVAPISKNSKYDWITLKYIPVESVSDLVFVFDDFLNAYGTEYDYALVPVTGGVEGDYIIDSIMSKFNGVFIGDAEQTFKFLYDVSYSSNSRMQQVGTFEPLGRQYPIIVANGLLSYETGSVSATILDDAFEETRVPDRVKTTNKKNALKDFLTNKNPKLMKDFNGNIWLIMVTSPIEMNYLQGSAMGVPKVQFTWTQVGDANDQESLYDNGMTNVPVV